MTKKGFDSFVKGLLEAKPAKSKSSASIPGPKDKSKA